MAGNGTVRLEITEAGEIKHPKTCAVIECRIGIFENVDRVVARAVELAGKGQILDGGVSVAMDLANGQDQTVETVVDTKSGSVLSQKVSSS